MKTKTFVKVDALQGVRIAPVAATFVAINEAKGCAIVASRDHTAVFGDDGTVATLHAVWATRSELWKSHEVGVESRTYQLLVIELEVS